MPDLLTTQKAVAQLAKRRPDIVSLARLASVAAVVEPALLRRLRKEAGQVARVATNRVDAEWDAGLEADLWFSSLAHVATADQLALRPEVLEILRSQLTNTIHHAEAAAARRVVSDAHLNHPEMVRLEERIIWSTLTGDTDDVAAALRRALATLKLGQQRATEVIRWFMQARRRLPAAALENQEGQRLIAAVAMHVDRAIPAELLAANRFPDVVADLAPASLPLTSVGVQIATGGIRFVSPDDPDAGLLRLPATRPLLVEVTWESAGGSERVALVRADVGSATPLGELSGSAVLRTIVGSRFRVVATRSRRIVVAIFGEVPGWTGVDEVTIAERLNQVLNDSEVSVQVVRNPTSREIKPEVLVLGHVNRVLTAVDAVLPDFVAAAQRTGNIPPPAAAVILTTGRSEIQDHLRSRLERASVPVRIGRPRDRENLVADAVRSVLASSRLVHSPDIDSEQPKVRSVRTVNAPPRVTPGRFQERKVETWLIEDFLRDRELRWLTVRGQAGVGKTELVRQLLRSVETGRLSDESGELWVDGIVYLGQISRREINFKHLFNDLTEILAQETAEGLREQYAESSQTPQRKMAALLDVIPSGRVVILFDGLDDLVDPTTLTLRDLELEMALTPLLAGEQHGVKVIATSRTMPRGLSGSRCQMLDLDVGLTTSAAIRSLRRLDPTGELGLRDATAEILTTAADVTEGARGPWSYWLQPSRPGVPGYRIC